jgi:hypothetical protein
MLGRGGVLLAVGWLACGWTGAQTVDRVFPVAPEDGGFAGPRPTLQVGVEGSELGKIRFRIELSADGFETVAHTFDQQEDPAGWVFTALGGENGAMYRARTPLRDGTWSWRVAAWNGVDWVKGRETRRLVVDGVPPADVTGLRMSVDPKTGSIVLDWDPVAADREGRPESVARYRIYRYERRSFFFVVRPFEIGETTGTRFVDDSRKAADAGMLFYKISAEDVAGNEFDRRY